MRQLTTITDMPRFVSDRILWTTVLVGAVLAYRYVPSYLEHVAQITITPKPPDSAPNKQLRTDAEQALSHDTLQVLSDGHSYDIRAAAIKIVAKRALTSKTKQLVLADLASKDAAKRWNAICALKLGFYHQSLSDKTYVGCFTDYKSLKAIVIALRNLLEEHKSSTSNEAKDNCIPSSPLLPPDRPAHEKQLLLILRDILALSPATADVFQRHVIDSALQAGLVSKWLTRYPFPCALPENAQFGFRRSDVTRLMTEDFGGSEESSWGKGDDPSLAAIFEILVDYPNGVDALEKAGLMPSAPEVGGTFHIEDVRMVNGESTAGALTPPELQELLETARDERRQHRFNDDIRRRHREAVVVAEAGVPLRREHILQRQDSETANTPFLRDNRSRLDLNRDVGLQEGQAIGNEQVHDPITVPERPWDLMRQEIEGEAIVNESIRESVGTFRPLRSSSHASSLSNEGLNEVNQEG